MPSHYRGLHDMGHLSPAPPTLANWLQSLPCLRAAAPHPPGMISHPGRTKMLLSLGKGASTAGTFWVLFIQISVCGEGRGGQNRMLPTGADLRPGLLSRPGAGSKPLLILLVRSTNTGCELRLSQALEVSSHFIP